MNFKNNIASVFSMKHFLILLIFALPFSACDDLVLPEEGSIADLTPPSANFSTMATVGEYKEINFTNLSISATDYVWDFGDGNTSTDKHPVHTYAEDGTYTVSLKASDKTGATSEAYTKNIEIVNTFMAVILNPGFDIQGDDEYRDHWRNDDLGQGSFNGIQITSSPVHSGEKAAKLPNDNSRMGYQLIAVQENSDYIISFYYTMKESPVGTLRVAVLAGHVTDPAAIDGAIIESVILNDQSDDGTYVQASLEFNSGDNTQVALYFDNEDVECRLDTFSISAN